MRPTQPRCPGRRSLALGAGHGINPAMGWLFAVALGLQRGSRRAVWGALGPLALGHAAAIALALAVAAAAMGLVVPVGTACVGSSRRCWSASACTGWCARGISPTGECRSTRRELATWSFLMASAHGAGLMVLPLVMGDIRPSGHAHHMAASLLGGAGSEWNGLSAALVHTAGYLLVTGAHRGDRVREGGAAVPADARG